MDTPKTLLVSLDLTELDTNLLQYAAHLSEVLPVHKVLLIHNILIEEPPQELKTLYPELEEPIDQLVKREIEEKADEFLPGKNLEVDIKIFQNAAITSIVKWVNRQPIDISLVGKKSELEGEGIFAAKFLRLTTHAVMLIPENATAQVSRIVAPIDFSKNAIEIVRATYALAQPMDADIKFLHVYTLPPQYFPYLPRDMDKYREEYLRYARKEFDRLKDKSLKQQTADTCHFKMIEKDDIATEIYLWAIEQQADLIVAGAKGKTSAAVILLGSVTEKLTAINNKIPLLVVKRKEHYGWLQALLDR